MAVQGNGRTGGRLIVDMLKVHGVDVVFSVAGESFLEVLDAFVDVPEVKLITCRQEGGAAFMAEAVGKLTGQPGVAIVTRGPGACNASIGVHTAFQDSTPMILLVGQVARDQAEREAFQEIDYRRMYGSVAKWAAQIDDAARIPELLSRAFHVAASGRPGPVVLALPEDMLRDVVDAADPRPMTPTYAAPAAPDLARLTEMLSQAQRPVMMVGGSGWTDEAARAIQGFAEAWNVPVCCSFRRQDVIDNRSESYIGDLGTGANPKLVARLKQADLLLVVGARLGEITTQGYDLMAIPQPDQKLIHIHANAEELGRVFRPDLAIQSGSAAFAAAIAGTKSASTSRWAEWAKAARADYHEWLVPGKYDGALDLGSAFVWLRDRLPENAIITSDAGNFSGWAQRFLTYRRPGRQLGPTSGAMGYGVPAAVAAAIKHPDRIVVGNVGDGGFMMTGQELSTAMAARAAPIILLFNNGIFGTIRMHQERRYPGRISGTDLVNPDFVALAKSYGAFAAKVERTVEFAPAFEEAVAAKRAAVLELRVDPEVITTRTTLSAIRAAALKK
ncbi:MAG TPA: thiamine pyrophosphate-binding protein [Magnetospirillaceae bacterium]|jgi:acetolactate synthase-1/2/3 large subunit